MMHHYERNLSQDLLVKFQHASLLIGRWYNGITLDFDSSNDGFDSLTAYHF